MLSKVKLYGDLAEFVGHKEFDVKVNSVAQAVSFLINNFPETEGYMSNRYYKVLVNEYEIDDTQIHEPTGKQEISFVPVISGAGGNTGRLLLGAALIGIAIVNPFGAASIGTFGGTPILVSKAVGFLGVGLALSGVSGLLFPTPKPKEFSNEQDPRISFGFSGIQQSSRAGSSHPICFGEVFTGSVVISAGIDTEQVRA